MHLEKVEANFWVKIATCMFCKGDFGIDVFCVCEFIVECDAEYFAILSVGNIIIVMANWW